MRKKSRVKHSRLEDLIPDESKRSEILNRLYKGDRIIGEGGIFTEMLQTLVNAALEGEMDNHLKESKAEQVVNRRNGHTQKRVKSRIGSLLVKTPRDRLGKHEPQLIGKWSRDLSTGMDEIIMSLYARGQSVEDIRNQLRELYGVGISAGAISSVTDRVYPEIVEWQQRPLSSCYPIVYLDAIHFKVREEGKVLSKAAYTAYGVTVDGQRDILGLYLHESEGARQWGMILEDIKRRGVEEVLIFCVDGLAGFQDVIDHVFPLSIVQRCIIHMIRNSTRFVSYKDIRSVCSDLRRVYTASDRYQAAIALVAFGNRWDAKYKEIRAKWEANWDALMAFMDYNENIRRIIYTTNPVESLHRVIRKVTKTKGAWCNEKGLIKQVYMALMYNKKSWNGRVQNWNTVQQELIDQFSDRYERYL